MVEVLYLPFEVVDGLFVLFDDEGFEVGLGLGVDEVVSEGFDFF